LRWRCCIQRRRERPKEKEVIVLLFSSVFLFFCSFPTILFLCSDIPFSILFCFQLLWFQTDVPLCFFFQP
jgi:hypothetical protein